MPISDKTRKILWGMSGNRCAICRIKLVIDPTEENGESVVGDECHIISGAVLGPRYSVDFEKEKIDQSENLILLCKVHHKMVDDQSETYTVSILKQIKGNHHKWIEEKLSREEEITPVRIKRVNGEIPKKIPRVQSGKVLLNMASACQGSYTDYSETLSEDEAELVGALFQNTQDWGDLYNGIEPAERVRAARSVDEQIKELESLGLCVFAATEKQRLEGGNSAPSAFTVLHLSVFRSTDPNVVIVPESEEE
ncbi:MAG TPA: HNH endonuclease [Cellvibrionaceae bacterium]